MKKNNIKQKHPGSASKNWFFSGLAVFAAALIFEMLLFMFAQTDRLSSEISDDFKILLISETELSVNLADVEKKIKEVPGVKSVIFVSKDEQLSRLEEIDPGLVSLAKKTKRNPLPDTWEVSIEDNAFFNLNNDESKDSIAYALLNIDGISEFQYKKPEAIALKHLFFYKRFSMLTICFSCVILAMFVLAVIVREYSDGADFGTFGRHDLAAILSGAAAGIFAFLIMTGFLYPVSRDNMLWEWTSPFSQFLLILFSALCSWGLCRWKSLK